MPHYMFKCEVCNLECEVIRSMKNIDTPPTREESPGGDVSVDETHVHFKFCDHKWKRALGRVSVERNWTGRKGFW